MFPQFRTATARTDYVAIMPTLVPLAGLMAQTVVIPTLSDCLVEPTRTVWLSRFLRGNQRATERPGLARLNADGSVDTSFLASSPLHATYFTGGVRALAA